MQREAAFYSFFVLFCFLPICFTFVVVDKTLGVLGKCYVLKCHMHKLLLLGIEDPAYSLVS